MKAALIIALMFAFAGCATNQSSNSHAQVRARAVDQSDQPQLVGMTKEQIARLLWRIE